jgi:hypothetical protein
LILVQVLGVIGVSVGLAYAYQPGLAARTLRLIAPPVVAPPQVSPPIAAEPEPPLELDIVVEDAGAAEWVAVEELSMVEGAWRTPDGTVLVSFLPRKPKAAPGDPNGLWRMTAARGGAPTLSCGLYEGLQYGADLPWRLAYCRGLAPDPQGPAEAVKVSLLRFPGQDQVQLVVGSELDVEIIQVQ